MGALTMTLAIRFIPNAGRTVIYATGGRAYEARYGVDRCSVSRRRNNPPPTRGTKMMVIGSNRGSALPRPRPFELATERHVRCYSVTRFSDTGLDPGEMG